MKTAQYYSMMLVDWIIHTVQIEPTSQILRYVGVSDENCKFEESFIDFVVSHKKTVQGMLEEMGNNLIMAQMYQGGCSDLCQPRERTVKIFSFVMLAITWIS